MKKWILIPLAILGVLVFMGVSLAMGYIGFQNTCNDFEIQIKAQYTDNQNVYDNDFKEVLEKSQVPKMYTNQLRELYREAMTDRYGEAGSQALFQFIQEQNPALDSAIFVQIQQSIESFRKRFQQAQTELVSRKQAYDRYTKATTSGRFYNLVGGYPKIDMEQYAIVTSDRTQGVFQTKRDEPLKLE